MITLLVRFLRSIFNCSNFIELFLKFSFSVDIIFPLNRTIVFSPTIPFSASIVVENLFDLKTRQPEEKLLKAIFGEKASDIKDTSLRVPSSVSGTVIDVQIFTRDGVDKNPRAKSNEDLMMSEFSKDLDDEMRIVTNSLKNTIIQALKKENLIKAKGKLTQESLEEMDLAAVLKIKITNKKITELQKNVSDQFKKYQAENKEKMNIFKQKVAGGNDLAPGVLSVIKVYLAVKRKIQAGDKLAGRHGNKGVVARIVKEEDMPFLEDGSTVDVVLNPLGVPSRMNIGQLYETALGWAGLKLNKKYRTPIFDGATADEVSKELDKAKLPSFGRTYLYDGSTGKKFDQKVTVGVIYILKLGHLIDDKMHSRSIGPYSLITQQPLGGKAQFGGQRFGEMEVWALEAFGASHVLQEILTIKSDDIIGRAKAYEAIVKGENMQTPGIPESFNVLIHELRGLALEITMK